MRFLTALVLTWLTAATTAFATPGQPTDRALGFQPSATPVMDRITDFNELLVWISIIVTLVVMLLLAWVILRFNRKANPVPSKNSHNTLLEVVWTALPVVVLIVISVVSFPLLYYIDVIPNDPDGEVPPAAFTLKATGNQWNWTYEYPDHGGAEFTSFMVQEEDLQPGQLRNLSTTTPVVVPVQTTVRVQVTASDVIHNWAMPAFGTKMDAIPGRLNETWFYVREEGVYYGQCSELCGVDHSFMPIEVHVVSNEIFEAWIAAGPESDEAALLLAEYEAARNMRLAQLD
jgi:cytochrome c oxidase subunit 2